MVKHIKIQLNELQTNEFDTVKEHLKQNFSITSDSQAIRYCITRAYISIIKQQKKKETN